MKKYIKCTIAFLLLFSMTFASFPLQVEASNDLVMDNRQMVIHGLNETHMWSNNGGNSWTRGREGTRFRGDQLVLVANYDAEIVSATPWTPRDFPGGSLVIYQGSLWRSKWWAGPGDVPGQGGDPWDVPWEQVRSVPSAIATFQFTRFTGQEALDYQESEAKRIEHEKKVIGYFGNWHGYKTDYQPDHPDYNYAQGIINGKGYDPINVPYELLTHVNYGFIIIDEDGNLASNDPWADYGDDKEGGGRNYINQIIQYANEHDTYTMFSIGGWNNSVYDKGFDIITETPEIMDRFTTQIVDFLLEFGFDGVDVDWEFPENDEEKEKFVALIKQIREKLTAAGIERDTYYQLSIAVTANHEKMEFVDPVEVNQYVDTFNVMSYDFRGGFDNQTGHHAALYPNPADLDQKFNTSSAMEEYANVYNIPKHKLLVGFAYYSRGFANVEEGVVGAPSSGVPLGGTWDDPDEMSGLKTWFQLKEFEAQAQSDAYPHLSYHWDSHAKAPYIYDAENKEFYTYENILAISHKINYTIDNGYGGAIIWELAHDTQETAELTTLINRVLTGDRIEIDEEEVPEEPTYLSFEVRNREPVINLDLSNEDFLAESRFMVYVDGQYHFETYGGINYYSYRENTETGVRVRRAFEGRQGQKVQIYLAPNSPGHSSEGKVLIEEHVLEANLTIDIPETEGFVKDMWYTDGLLYITLDKAAYQAENRIIIRQNGKYIAETYNNRSYYSFIVSETEDTITIRRSVDLQPGNVISAELFAGAPGYQNSQRLAIIATWEYE